jgi:hypothetical protein
VVINKYALVESTMKTPTKRKATTENAGEDQAFAPIIRAFAKDRDVSAGRCSLPSVSRSTGGSS